MCHLLKSSPGTFPAKNHSNYGVLFTLKKSNYNNLHFSLRHDLVSLILFMIMTVGFLIR
jgi:hypothetical protein